MDKCVYISLEVKNKEKQCVHFLNLLPLNSVFMKHFLGIDSRLIREIQNHNIIVPNPTVCLVKLPN